VSGRPIRIALVGIGKIARDQHLPALAANPDYELAAAVSRHGRVDGVANFVSIADFIQADMAVDAVSLCTPPQGRHAIARQALDAGLHVMLEKPPGATVSEVHDLEHAARSRGVVLFATWHSRESAAVAPAREWLADKEIRSVQINWKEDVRRWHPGQTWIWQPGGLGVFDPGINALSVLTAIMPAALFVTGAELQFPSNCEAPIRARLEMSDARETPIRAEFDFLQTGEQTWEILVETDGGPLHLSSGGAMLEICGERKVEVRDAEYPNLYRRFAELVQRREPDVDLSPVQLVADAFLLGKRVEVEPFVE
jgi:D-galactose 1-dehydrogenase